MTMLCSCLMLSHSCLDTAKACTQGLWLCTGRKCPTSQLPASRPVLLLPRPQGDEGLQLDSMQEAGLGQEAVQGSTWCDGHTLAVVARPWLLSWQSGMQACSSSMMPLHHQLRCWLPSCCLKGVARSADKQGACRTALSAMTGLRRSCMQL